MKRYVTRAVLALGILAFGAGAAQAQRNGNGANAASSRPSFGELGGTACSLTNISPGAAACVGWYGGNLNSDSPAAIAATQSALNALTFSGTPNPNISANVTTPFTVLETLGTLTGNTINFATPLFGETVISFHVGAANGAPNSIGYDGTAFFRFDAGNLPGGLDSFIVNVAGLSNARLFSTGQFVSPPPNAVPEPATWAMLILGTLGAGAALRRRRAKGALAAA